MKVRAIKKVIKKSLASPAVVISGLFIIGLIANVGAYNAVSKSLPTAQVITPVIIHATPPKTVTQPVAAAPAQTAPAPQLTPSPITPQAPASKPAPTPKKPTQTKKPAFTPDPVCQQKIAQLRAVHDAKLAPLLAAEKAEQAALKQKLDTGGYMTNGANDIARYYSDLSHLRNVYMIKHEALYNEFRAQITAAGC